MTSHEVSGVRVLRFETADPDRTDEADEVFQAVQKALSRGECRIVVDLASVASMKAPVLGVLNGAARKCRESGGALAVCRVDRAILKVFQLAGLDAVFVIRDTEEDAVAHLAPLGSS